MSVYRSRAGKQVLYGCYDEALTQLEIDVDEEWIKTRCGSTHVLCVGPADAQPVLVFHGGNATNPMTLAWYTDLADEFRLIAPDTIGHPGKSAETRLDPQDDGYGDWVVDLLDAFELQSTPMIGTSYGAGIVLRTAAVAPDRIDRAALVVPAGFGTGSLVSMMRIGLPAMCYRFLARERLLDLTLDKIVTESNPNPVIRETIAASFRYVHLEREFPSATVTELEEFSAPVALFAGENDPFFPPDIIVPRATEVLPRLSKTEVVSNEKHIISPSAQHRITEKIWGFL